MWMLFTIPSYNLWKTSDCLFRLDPAAAYLADSDFRENGLEVRVMLRPTSFPFSLSFGAGEKYHRDTRLMWHIKRGKQKEKYFRSQCHPHAIHFINCVTAVQFRNGTANHCNQVPICTHSINLLPVDHVFFVALRPPTGVRQKVR